MAREPFGIVYLAEEVTLARRVAFKLVSERRSLDMAARQRFLRAARAIASVEHPNVVFCSSDATDTAVGYSFGPLR